MKIDEKEIYHIAKLSKLNIEKEKIEKLTSDLSDIVELANTLSEVNVDNVSPTAHILDIKNVFRKDEAQESSPREEILQNAPEKQAGCINVPKVVE